MCLLSHVESTGGGECVRDSVTLIHLSSNLRDSGPLMTPTPQLITLLKVLGEGSSFLHMLLNFGLSAPSLGTFLLGLLFWCWLSITQFRLFHQSGPRWRAVLGKMLRTRSCNTAVVVRLALCCDAQALRVLFCGIFFLSFESHYQTSLLPNI